MADVEIPQTIEQLERQCRKQECALEGLLSEIATTATAEEFQQAHEKLREFRAAGQKRLDVLVLRQARLTKERDTLASQAAAAQLRSSAVAMMQSARETGREDRVDQLLKQAQRRKTALLKQIETLNAEIAAEGPQTPHRLANGDAVDGDGAAPRSHHVDPAQASPTHAACKSTGIDHLTSSSIDATVGAAARQEQEQQQGNYDSAVDAIPCARSPQAPMAEAASRMEAAQRAANAFHKQVAAEAAVRREYLALRRKNDETERQIRVLMAGGAEADAVFDALTSSSRV